VLCVLLHLVQVVDGSYAFVLHTANPLTGRLGEMFGELVPGLGEVLVRGKQHIRAYDTANVCMF
jgi:phosphoenolpyruvate synthase/pyruvate phosphate dikinase